MTLSSTSTLAEIQAAHDDNADYDVAGSTSKCAAFIGACRLLLRRLHLRQSIAGNEIATSAELLAEQLAAARRWYGAMAGAGGGVVHPDFSRLRD